MALVDSAVAVVIAQTEPSLVDSIIAFAIGVLVGALGIYVGAMVITDVEDYTYAIVTALIATVVWVVVAFFFGWIPLLGPLLALIVYVGIIHWRYPGGWLDAIGIALLAWVTSLVVLWVLAAVGFGSMDAIGVPGA